MKYRFTSLRVISVLFVIVAIALGSCRENTLIKSTISPTKDSLGVWDTSLALITHTYYNDTAVTSINIGGIPIYQAVGAITDPYFGTMTAATYFQVVPTDFTANIYTNDSIDSAVLVLPFSGFTYGDTADRNISQTYQVFYMNDTMGLNTTYYSYSTKPLDLGSPLSDPFSVNIHSLNDSFGVNVLPSSYAGLRIKLNLPNLLNKLLPALDGLGSGGSVVQDFQNAFKGLCVRAYDPTLTNNAIPYFQLEGSNLYSRAGIIVYHHTKGNPSDSKVQNYYFNTASCAHFNTVSKSYSGFPVNNLFQSTQPNDDIVALQNLPGATIDVVIPGIKSLPGGVINKAEIQFTLLPDYYTPNHTADTLFTPFKLYPLGVSNGSFPAGVPAGLEYNISDRYPLTSLSPLGVMDGFLHSFNRNGTTVKTFTLNIPRELMYSISAKNDTLHLHINGTADFYGAFHVVAGGGNHSNPIYRAKLFVVYSKLTK